MKTLEDDDILSSYINGQEDNDSEIDFSKEDNLKKTSDLNFLKEEERTVLKKVDNNWSLYFDEKKLDPLIFSNGKSQEDVVREVVDLIKKGEKIIFVHGVCGTGKSAIALNIARHMGRTSIVVPIKSLQRQYEEDYMGKMFLYNKNGRKMRIAMITGRQNHDSIIFPGVSCADPYLPDTIKISDKNYDKLQ